MNIDLYTAQFVPVSASAANESRLNDGGRVLLPQSVLEAISHMQMVYPLQFKITAFRQKPVYAAVLEFSAEMGTVVLPDWMYTQLQLRPRSVVRLETCNLQAGHIVKLQPHKREFVMLQDPRRVLEQRLTHYPVLSAGSTIVIHYLNRAYQINVVEILSAEGRALDAVLTARADGQATELKVEFDRPLDMPPSPTEHERNAHGGHGSPTSKPASNVIGSAAEGGVLFKDYAFQPPSLLPPDEARASPDAEEAAGVATAQDSAPPAFTPFTGTGRSLSGAAAPPSTGAPLSEEAQRQLREKRLQALTKRRPA